MPIISKETWDKFTQEEKESIQEMYNHYKEYKFNKSDEEQEGAVSAYDTLFGKENLQPQPLTYEDVARELFMGRNTFYPDIFGAIQEIGLRTETICYDHVNCTSRKQAEKLLAINKLLNVAKFLNKDWKPDCSNEDAKFYTLGIDNNDNSIKIIEVMPYYTFTTEIVNFEEKELAKQAIQILGEDTVRLALSSDF